MVTKDSSINLAVFVDFRKAFDVLDHDIICRKLEVYQFRDKSVNFLSGSTQQVTFTMPYLRKDTYSVPHGSVLGPLLFCIIHQRLTPMC